jgi:hypothetical protein
VLTGTVVLGRIIWYNYGPSLGHGIVEILDFCAFLSISVPIIYAKAQARNLFRKQSPPIKDRTYALDTNGFGFESEMMSLHFS